MKGTGAVIQWAQGVGFAWRFLGKMEEIRQARQCNGSHIPRSANDIVDSLAGEATDLVQIMLVG